MRELFAENGLPESLCIDNGPKFANTLFAEFATYRKFDHNTSASRNPRSNGQAETVVNILNGPLTHATCSGQDPYLALLAYHSTPINAHLCYPAELRS